LQRSAYTFIGDGNPGKGANKGGWSSKRSRVEQAKLAVAHFQIVVQTSPAQLEEVMNISSDMMVLETPVLKIIYRCTDNQDSQLRHGALTSLLP
jgi:hypothetical protein